MRRMKRRLTPLVAGGLFLLALVGSAAEPAARHENNGWDLDTVLLFFGWRMPDAGFTNLPASLTPAVQNFCERQARFRSRLPRPTSDAWDVDAVFQKHLHAERIVWSLFTATGIERTATDFASTVDLALEWEGFSSGPLAEAASGERYLRADPDTPIASYVHLFIGHRYVCAAPLLTSEKKQARGTEASRRAQAELALAARSAQPLVRFLALHLKATPHCFSNPPAR
jgi:hypothetical protein